MMTRSQPVNRRVCVIGAGFSGLGAAHGLQEQGIEFDILEATGRVGGNWSHGVYDSSHLISGKRSTEYREFPMPDDYPTFPAAPQVLTYFESYAEHFHLYDHIEFGKKVLNITPIDATGLDGWTVTLDDGDIREYGAVVVANGHDWSMKIPDYPGEFSGQQLHSKEYKRPRDVTGDRVLVVGCGNSAVDIAEELSRDRTRRVDVSMRRTYWFLPKTVFGVPISSWDRWYLPETIQKILLHSALLLTTGPYRSMGLPRPTHGVFTESPTVNETFPAALRHGRARYRPGIERLEGRAVHFVDGTVKEYDAIVWGTGFRVDFPFLDDKYINRGDDGKPVLTARLVPDSGVANLYLFGVVFPRSGGGPLISRLAPAIASSIRWQWNSETPIEPSLRKIMSPSSEMSWGAGRLTRKAWQMRHYARIRAAIASTRPRRRSASTERLVRHG